MSFVAPLDVFFGEMIQCLCHFAHDRDYARNLYIMT